MDPMSAQAGVRLAAYRTAVDVTVIFENNSKAVQISDDHGESAEGLYQIIL